MRRCPRQRCAPVPAPHVGADSAAQAPLPWPRQASGGLLLPQEVLGEHFGVRIGTIERMKFGMSIEKKNSANIGQAEGHNARHHPTKSQLPKSAWLTDAGHHTLKKWDAGLLAKSKALAKRRDAVFAVELIIQVGNQTDWREPPTVEHPNGKPKSGNSKKMNALMAGVKEAALSEFSEGRIISIEMHTDESTPHVHVIFAPILDRKLNAKNWTGGAARCAQLRERLYEKVNKHIECEYTKGAPGGAPHDPLKAAGGPRSPAKNDEVTTLRSLVDKLRQEVQTLFSQLKAEQKKALKLKAENDDFAEEAMKRMEALQAEIKRLSPAPPTALKKPAVGGISALVAGQTAPVSARVQPGTKPR